MAVVIVVCHLHGADAHRLRLLDQDIAQVERLARLDGEVLADLHPLVLVVDGREVDDPVQGAGDQGDQGDAALGVGARRVPVVLAVDVGDELRVGRQLGLVLLVPAVSARAGRGDELEVGPVLGDRLAVGPDEPRLGLAARLRGGSSGPRRPACRRSRPMRPTRARGRGCGCAWTPRGPGRAARSGRRGSGPGNRRARRG